jgi:hypothetical protein
MNWWLLTIPAWGVGVGATLELYVDVDPNRYIGALFCWPVLLPMLTVRRTVAHVRTVQQARAALRIKQEAELKARLAELDRDLRARASHQ